MTLFSILDKEIGIKPVGKPQMVVSLEKSLDVPIYFRIEPLNYRKKSVMLSNITSEEVSVGWGCIDLITRDCSQKRISTTGIRSCYAMIGISVQCDIILGHYFDGNSLLDLVVPDIQAEITRKKLTQSDFSFAALPGPGNHHGLDYRFNHYNISISKEPLAITVTGVYTP